MIREIPITNADGAIMTRYKHLLTRLHREASKGLLHVICYRGVGVCGSEAFYTLGDGTVLHEVNSQRSDGTNHRAFTLVVKQDNGGLLQRCLSARRLPIVAVGN